jgi:hypothetical protein
MDNWIGEYQWYANLNGNVWDEGSDVPVPGQIIFIHWVYKEERSIESLAKEEATDEYWRAVFKEAAEETKAKRLAEQWERQRKESPFSFIVTRTEMV